MTQQPAQLLFIATEPVLNSDATTIKNYRKIAGKNTVLDKVQGD